MRTTDADEFVVAAKQCVLATGVPILDRGGFFHLHRLPDTVCPLRAAGRRGISEGRSVVDGVERRVSPVCPHLGGIVNWNDADESWECPLHGSRFAPDGKLLEGPATRDLTAAQ